MTQARRASGPLSHLPWVVALVFRSAPVDAALNLLSVVLRALTPPLVLLGLQQVIDAVASGSVAAFHLRVEVLAALLLFTELTGGLFMTDNRLLNRVSAATQALVLDKATALSVSLFDEPHTHDLIERASRHTDRAARVWQRVMAVASATVRVAAAAMLVVAALPLVTLLLVGAASLLALVELRTARTAYGVDSSQAAERRRLEYLAGLLSSRAGAAELRAYGLPAFFTARWRETFRRYSRVQIDVRRAALSKGWAADFVALLAFGLALLAVVRRALSGGAAAGELVALIGATGMLQEGTARLAREVSGFLAAVLPVADLRAFLALKGDERRQEEGLRCPSGPIRFESVTFYHSGRPAPVLDNVSFTIEPGETVALVGRNGAGKTTLVKLLLGLYEPHAGRITVGGADLRKIAPASLRRHFSAVFQDFARLDLTLADNVSACDPTIDRSAVSEACEAVGLGDVARRLPHGLDTPLGKTFTGGAELSGGQWQRVAIGRAYARKAAVLVLDEPTAALDPMAELETLGRFVELTAGRTALLISHRLGAARLADRILVLDGGRLVDSGRHDELLARGGVYADLFHAQANWYREAV